MSTALPRTARCRTRQRPRVLLLLVCGLLAACAPGGKLKLPESLAPAERADTQPGDSGPPQGQGTGSSEAMPAPPKIPAGGIPGGGGRTFAVAPADSSTPVNLNFEQVPLTTLIQVVYTEILGRPVNLDPQVMERRDLVTFRTPAKQTPRQVQEAMRVLLRSYGLAALDLGGLVRIVPDSVQTGQLPEIRRGAALPETPDPLRPVFQLVELQAVRNTDVAGWLGTIMGGRVTIAEDPGRNALILTGTAENVAAALEAIRALDQPVMRGRSSLRISPVYLAAEELSRRLVEVLSAEGYAVAPPSAGIQSGGIRYPVMFVPIPASNALLVFTQSDQVLAHVQEWVSRLDRPSEQGPGKGYVTYTAQYVSAGKLAQTLGQILAGGSERTGTGTGTLQDGQSGMQGQTGQSRGFGSDTGTGAETGNYGGVVVDQATNTLIFRTTAEDYSYISGLLRTLDRPAPSALIEVTVAELQLTDDTQMGLEWLLTESLGGNKVRGGTLGGLSLGSGGLKVARLDSAGDTRLVLNALASNNRATILSSPRIMARNAEEATIQVGQEVPIITSQQSTLSGAVAGGDTGVLQSVDYRETGVILRVKPTIHPGNRVDLQVSQEVSAAQPTLTGVDNSPTF
ncbi:MAG: secretin N-terminal domain-containing protein, partial [Gammaproteobacteria bacterium]